MVSKEFPNGRWEHHAMLFMIGWYVSQVPIYHALFLSRTIFLMFRSPKLPPAIMILMTHTGAHPQFRQEVMFLKVLHKIVWLVGQGHPSEKYDFVNWDDESNPILMGKSKKWQPNHQPVVDSVDTS